MPRPVRFKTAAVKELLKQLRFASADVRLRQMNAAEKLAREINTEQTYPEEFIIFRVTGYRPDSKGTGTMLFGAALQGDLARLVTELSKELVIEVRSDRPALSIEALAARWRVSLKSLSRYRHRGLICHMLMLDGRQRLACYEDEAERFATAHPDTLARAAGFRRMDAETIAAIVDEAVAARRTGKKSLNTLAKQLAKKHGRSLEAVRGVLLRHNARCEEPIFSEPGPLSERQKRVIDRAWRMGMTPGALSRRFGKSVQTIHRALSSQRFARLKALPIAFVNMPTFDREDADDVILSPASVRSGLGEDVRFREAATLLEAIKEAKPSDVATEQRLAAYNWLKRRAMLGISSSDDAAKAESLDAIETSLRWASRIKRRLVEGALAAAVRSVEQALHRPLLEQPTAQVLSLLAVAVKTTSQAVDAFDPSRSQQLDRAVAFAVGRAMATLSIPDRPGRAAARHAGESLATAELFDALNPWQAWLDLPWRWRAKVHVLPSEQASVVELVIGLGDEAPRTVGQAARKLGITKSHAAQKLHQAWIGLRRAGAGE